jgi:hypothetical protein
MLFNAVNGNGNLRITIFAPFSGDFSILGELPKSAHLC